MNPDQLPLEDIRVPGEVALWPPAPGWWILAALILVMLIIAFFQYRRYKRDRVQRKLALEALAEVDLQNQSAAQQINEILKRAAMAYIDREKVAPLNGLKWKHFLLSNAKSAKISAADFDDQWLHMAYSGKVEQKTIYQYHSFAEQWLKTALPLKTAAQTSQETVS